MDYGSTCDIKEKQIKKSIKYYRKEKYFLMYKILLKSRPYKLYIYKVLICEIIYIINNFGLNVEIYIYKAIIISNRKIICYGE